LSSKKILTIIIICASIAFSAGNASAESPLNFPVWLWGNVNIDGNPAPAGTIITTFAGNSPVGSIKFLTAGIYGEMANDRLPVSASDGAQVDFYVNGQKATPSTTFIYHLNDAGKVIRVDLNAPSGTSGTTGPSVGSVNGGSGGGGGGSGAAGTPKATAAIEKPVTTKESTSGTPAKGTPVETPVKTPESPVFNYYTILGVFVLMVGVIALKKMGKI